MFGLIQDLQLTMEQSHTEDTWSRNAQEIIQEGTACMVDWIENTGKCVYPEKMNYPTSLINVEWNTPDEADDMLPIQPMWDWLCGFVMTRMFTC